MMTSLISRHVASRWVIRDLILFRVIIIVVIIKNQPFSRSYREQAFS
jgi:hypothetical protein